MSQEQLNTKKLKKARLLSELEMLTQVSDLHYINLGKVTAEIHILEKKQNQEVKSLYHDN